MRPTQARPVPDGAGLPAAAGPGGAHLYSPAEVDEMTKKARSTATQPALSKTAVQTEPSYVILCPDYSHVR